MRQLRLAFIAVFINLLLFSLLFANSMNGGLGLNYIKSAWVLKPGYLTFTPKIRFFGKVSSPLKGAAVTYWDVQGAFSLNYGINEHFEIALTPIMYQDSHKQGSKGYNLPDDLFLSVKAGSYQLGNSPFIYGGFLEARFPTASDHNLAFEPYSSGNVALTIAGMLTYSRDPLYPQDNVNVHLNFGYINHNDVGQDLVKNAPEEVGIKNMSQELFYGIGIKIPTIDFDFLLEINGNTFVQKPPKELSYSRENFLYLTPGISFRANRWLSLNFSTDVRLTADQDESTYDWLRELQNMPNYPSWRINLGAKIVLLPTSVYKISEKDVLIRKAESRRELFEQIIREQRETESAEEELERIKTERKKAERELERLRRILEGETKSRKEDNE
jgi:hypothetical protein